VLAKNNVQQVGFHDPLFAVSGHLYVDTKHARIWSVVIKAAVDKLEVCSLSACIPKRASHASLDIILFIASAAPSLKYEATPAMTRSANASKGRMGISNSGMTFPKLRSILNVPGFSVGVWSAMDGDG